MNDIFAKFDAQSRLLDIRSFLQILLSEKISKETITNFLRSLGLPDAIIIRAFTYVT